MIGDQDLCTTCGAVRSIIDEHLEEVWEDGNQMDEYLVLDLDCGHALVVRR